MRQVYKNPFTIGGLSIFALIILLPLFLGNRFSIDVSSDMAFHTSVVKAMIDGTPKPPLPYQGDIIVGLILFTVIAYTKWSIASVYLGFNFLALLGVAFTLFYVTRKLVGVVASWLIIPIVFFVAPGILVLFRYGVIFSIINMYIILPWAIYYGIKWITQKRKRYAAMAVMLVLLFGVFHTTALYLPFVIGCLIIVAFLTKNYKVAFISFGVVVVTFFIALVALPAVNNSGALALIGDLFSGDSLMSPWRFISSFMGYPLALLLVLSLVAYILSRRYMRISFEAKMFMLVWLCFVIPLTVATFATSENNGTRVAIDLSTILAILTACLLGLVIQKKGWTVPSMLSAMVTGGATVINTVVWLR